MESKEKQYSGIKAGIWYTVGNMIIKGIPFFSIPIFTRLLETEDFGLYNTYLSYEGIMCIVLGLGISGTVKTAKFEFKESFEQYMSSVFSLILSIGLAILAVANILYALLPIPAWITRFMLNLLIVQSIASAIYSIMGCKYVIKCQYIQNLIITFVMTAINIGASLVLCFVGMNEQRHLARITGTALGAIAVALYILLSQRKSAKLGFYGKANKYALKIGVPLIPHLLSGTLLSQCDKIMIQSMIGNSEAGIYSLAVNIISILAVFVTSIDNAWAPWYYTELSKSNYKEIKEKNNNILVLFMYLTCGFLLIGPDIIKIMAKEAYWDSRYAFIPLTISIYLNFMYLFAVNLEYYKKKTWKISQATIICAVVNIVLNVVLIKNFGYMAAAYATLLSKFLLFALHQYNAKKLEKEKIIGYRYLFGTLGVVCLVGTCDYLFINNFWVRCAMIIFISIFAGIYFYKKGYLEKYIRKVC